MKVHVRKTKVDPRVGFYRCFNCGTIFEVERGDLGNAEHHRNGGPQEPDDYWTLPCPSCRAPHQLLHARTQGEAEVQWGFKVQNPELPQWDR